MTRMTSVLLAATLMGAAAPALAADCAFMGGTANVHYISQTEGIAAMTGAFSGGAYATVTSAPEEVGGGRTEFDMRHYFIHEYGSTIFTEDRSFLQRAESGEITAGGTDYTVVSATGRFEGMRGTFHSRGGWLLERGVGALRFEGEICR